MSYKRSRSRINKRILFFILAIIFSFSSVVLMMRLPECLGRLTEVQAALAEVNEMKEQNEKEVVASQNKIDDLHKEIESLKKEVQIAQEENPELCQALQSEEMKYAYLTFDDGPSENTEKILDFLSLNNIKATFFVIGTEGYDHVYKRIVDEGHTLAVHSNTHKYNEIYASVWAFMQDITTLSNKLYDITGAYPKILRFPGGSNNTISKKYNSTDIMGKLIAKVEEEGYCYFDWNVDSLDASAVKQDKQIIVESVLEGAKDKKNAIILMHDAGVKTTTVEALPEIVEGLRRKGFVFERITEETIPIQFK